MYRAEIAIEREVYGLRHSGGVATAITKWTGVIWLRTESTSDLFDVFVV
jgi:hypothetical protein